MLCTALLRIEVEAVSQEVASHIKGKGLCTHRQRNAEETVDGGHAEAEEIRRAHFGRCVLTAVGSSSSSARARAAARPRSTAAGTHQRSRRILAGDLQGTASCPPPAVGARPRRPNTPIANSSELKKKFRNILDVDKPTGRRTSPPGPAGCSMIMQAAEAGLMLRLVVATSLGGASATQQQHPPPPPPPPPPPC